jgi:hypothetical protein
VALINLFDGIEYPNHPLAWFRTHCDVASCAAVVEARRIAANIAKLPELLIRS